MFFNLYDFYTGSENYVQVISLLETSSTDIFRKQHLSLNSLSPLVPVAVTAVVKTKPTTKISTDNAIELELRRLIELNSVSKDLIYTPEALFPPEKRHLQLRSSRRLSSALRLRATAAAICRDELTKAGFLEVETPLLFKSTPEGAREFIVPTRKDAGICYALPQSPQQYKQILMASGVPRYYQLAKCFRDEDLRADRQPEFTQLDLEMSFARGKDVIDVTEKLLKRLWKETLNIETTQFKRMSYNTAMSLYGTDKPDLRFDHIQIKRIRLGVGDDKNPTEGFVLRPAKETSHQNIQSFIDEFKTEYQVPGKDQFIIYNADINTAYGIPESHLTVSDIDTVHKSLAVQPGDLVVLHKRHQGSRGVR